MFIEKQAAVWYNDTEENMNRQLNQEMNRAFDMEESGHFEEAIRLCKNCIQDFPEYQSEIEIEIAKMNYRNGKEEVALLQLLQLYEEGDQQEILDFILEVFYCGYKKEYDRQYQENCSQLKEYAYFYGNMPDAEIRYYPIYAGEQNIWYYDSAESKFEVIKRGVFLMEEDMDSVCLSRNLLWAEDILKLEEHTRKKNPLMDMENPLLLVYDRDTWELLLQLLNLKDFMNFDRIVFYESQDWLETSFLEDGLAFPEICVVDDSDTITDRIDCIRRRYHSECESYRAEAAKYYEGSKEEIMRRIREGTPRIFFMTSRFTTTLQYHINACRETVRRMHLATELSIEKDRLNRGEGRLVCLKKIVDFKPDIVFIIDHFRFEFAGILGDCDNLVWVCWVQDPMPYIMDKASPMKLRKCDIILNHLITWQKFQEVGYDKRRLLDAPIPADSHIYKHYSLSQEEKKEYGCDICFVCHASDVDAWIEKSVKDMELSENETSLFYEICKKYQRLVYEMGKCFYREEEFCQYIKDTLQLGNYAEEMIRVIAGEMYLWLNQRVYRQALVDWLLDAGYTNIKLWGNGWQTDPKYAPYAMGPARNGETLSKIYHASKIVVGNNVMCTAAARAWESMLSGAFYMSNYVPQEVDVTDIRKIMKEGEELVMFYDREDFLQKVEYYLTHEAERQHMAEIGHRAALERMTFDKLMQTMIREIPERISQLEQEES